MGIQTEKDGRAFYVKASLDTQDEGGRALFAHLAEDELMHLAMLEGQLASLRRDGAWQPTVEPSPAKMATPIFARELSAAELNHLTSDLSALRLAYLIERDAVAFYSHAAHETDAPEGKAMFEALVAMEQGHYNRLVGEYSLLSEQFKHAMGFEPF